MASNEPGGHHIGAVKTRSQIKTKIHGQEHWTKRSKESGQFMDQKADHENLRAYLGRSEGPRGRPRWPNYYAV